MSNPIYSDPEWMQKFLHNAAIYFENRPTDGEDTACWANAYNAEKCIKIAAEVTHLRAEITRLRAELATARRDGMEEAAQIAEECYRQNGPLSQRGFPERYREGLAAGAQAIAAAIRAAAGEQTHITKDQQVVFEDALTNSVKIITEKGRAAAGEGK